MGLGNNGKVGEAGDGQQARWSDHCVALLLMQWEMRSERSE